MTLDLHPDNTDYTLTWHDTHWAPYVRPINRSFVSGASHKKADVIPSDGIRPTAYHGGNLTITPLKTHSTIDVVVPRISPYNDVRTTYEYTTNGNNVPTDGLPINRDGILHYSLDHFFLEAQATTKLVRKIKDQEVDLGIAFAELNKTAALLLQSVHPFLDAYRYARRGQWNRVAQAFGGRPSRTASNKWLEYQYGWQPMLNDISGIAKTLEDGLKNYHGKRFTVSATAVEEEDPSGISSLGANFGGKIKKGVRAQSTYKVHNPRLANLDSLGLLNPASAAWELIPFSFVLDWFIPIGPLLNAASIPMHTQWEHGFRTHFAECDLSYTVDEDYSLSSYWGIANVTHKSQSKITGNAMKRYVNTFPPYVSPFGGTGIGSKARLATAFALAITRAKYR